jgi:hypothetical protein
MITSQQLSQMREVKTSQASFILSRSVKNFRQMAASDGILKDNCSETLSRVTKPKKSSGF